MIPVNSPRGEVISGGNVHEKVDFRLSSKRVAHLMRQLSAPYSDKPLAVVREYSTNASDSHILAGNPDPIVVSLPSKLFPHITITDRGVGMSREDIVDTYVVYGDSTKIGSDDLNGILGMGSKAALSLANSFTVTGIKDGRKTVMSVLLNEDGIPQGNIVVDMETDEPNGVSVMVPVAPEWVAPVKTAAQKFFGLWEKGKALVDGEDLSRLDDLTDVGDGVLIDNGKSVPRGLTILMGGVGYPVPFRYFSLNASVVAKISMGEFPIEFTISRESLEFSSVTKKSVESIAARCQTKIHNYVKSALGTAKSLEELRGTLSLARTVGVKPDAEIDCPGASDLKLVGTHGAFRRADGSPGPHYSKLEFYDGRLRSFGGIGLLDINMSAKAERFTIAPLPITGARRARLRQWVIDNDVDTFMVFDHEIGKQFMSDDKFVPFDEIAKVALPKRAAGVKRVKKNKQFYVLKDAVEFYYSHNEPVEVAPDADNVYIIRYQRGKSLLFNITEAYGKDFPDGKTIIVSSDVEQDSRYFDNVKVLDPAVEKVRMVAEIRNGVANDKVLSAHIRSYRGAMEVDYDVLAQLDIEDPDLVELVKENVRLDIKGRSNRAPYYLEYHPDYKSVRTLSDHIKDHYPLLRWLRHHSDPQAIREYINTFYKVRNS